METTKEQPKKTHLDNLMNELFTLFIWVMGAIMVLGILSYFTHSGDSFGTSFEKLQEKNHALFKGNDNLVSEYVFKQYPNAQTILLGNLYVTDDKFKFTVRPTDMFIENICNIDSDALAAEKKYQLQVVSGTFINGKAVITNIKPFNSANKINLNGEEEKDFGWFAGKLFSLATYAFPAFDDLVKAGNRTNVILVKMGTEMLPYAVAHR